jgi:copper(I)-binding protein
MIDQIQPATRARPAARPAPGSLAGLLRAAIAPVICSALLLAMLSAWVITGGDGTLTRVTIEITTAAVAEPASAGTSAPTYLTVVNLSGADRLVSVTTPDARRVELVQHDGDPATPGKALTGAPIGAHATVTFSPFGTDIVLIDPARLGVGASVPLTLRFASAGRVTVDATVTPPGTP